MEQTSIVRNLATWITANPWHPLLTVLYDLCSYGVPGESQRGALYMGEKRKDVGGKRKLHRRMFSSGVKTAVPSNSLWRWNSGKIRMVTW